MGFACVAWRERGVFTYERGVCDRRLRDAVTRQPVEESYHVN